MQVNPVWIQAALAKAAATPEHAADMAALGAPREHLDSWPVPGAVPDVMLTLDPLAATVLERIHQRSIRATEEAGRLYQHALDAWRASWQRSQG